MFSKNNTQIMALFTGVLALGMVFMGDARAYQIEASSVTILPAIINADSSMGKFRVESNLVLLASPDWGESDEEVVIPEEAPGTPSVSLSLSGGGRYDASNWILKRKYDELVALRDAGNIERVEDENIHKSAPEKIIYEDEQYPSAEAPPVVADSSVETDFVIDESGLTQGERVAPVENETFVSVEAFEGPIDAPATAREVADPVTVSNEVLIASDTRLFSSIPPLYFGENHVVQQGSPSPYWCEKKDIQCECVEKSNTPDAGNTHDTVSLFQNIIVVLVSLIFFLILLEVWTIVRYQMILRDLQKSLVKSKKKTVKHSRYLKLKKFFFFFLILGMPLMVSSVFAGEKTTPNEIYYQGALKDDNGQYLEGEYDFRFSLWSSQDYVENTDIIVGEIQPIDTFLGWSEIQMLDISNGKFYFEVGSIISFPEDIFHSLDVYLQIEIKESAELVTSFEFIDIDASDPLKDRMGFTTVPYARNADELDYRDTGFEPGNIPYLNEEGKLNESLFPSNSMFPAGTNEDFFTIDNDDSVAADGSIDLVFGSTLAKTLSYNRLSEAFEFNDSVSISGNLIVTGTINGTYLQPRTITDVLSPEYKNSVFMADGSDNAGSMHGDIEEVGNQAFHNLRWETQSTTLQDYDIYIKYTLPEDFAGFDDSTPITVSFRTDGTSTQSIVDLTLEKEGVLGVDQFQGAGMGLSSNTWEDQAFSLNEVVEWTPLDAFIIKIKLSALADFDSRVGDIKISYKK